MDTRSPYFELVQRATTSSPWIVMVHGVSQDRRVFSTQVDAFATDYQLILIDLPGHGLSSDSPGPYGLEEFSESIQRALVRAGVELPIFWGTHLGAGAGLLLACRHQSLFQSMILEAPVFPGRPLPAVNDLLSRIGETARLHGIGAARTQWWHEGGWFAVMRDNPEQCRAREHLDIINSFTGRPWLDAGLASRPIASIDQALAKLGCPILIMNGEFDLQDFRDVADDLIQALPDGQHVTIEGGGGFPLWEFPERVNDVVRKFLDEKHK